MPSDPGRLRNVVAAALLATLIPVAAWAVMPSAEATGIPQTHRSGPGAGTGTLAVMVELEEEPTAVVYARTLAGRSDQDTKAAATASAREQLALIEQQQLALISELESGAIGARVLYRLQRVFNGIAIRVERRAIQDIMALPGVRTVRPIPPVKTANSTGVPFLGVPKAWTNPPGVTGAGVSVGIIDSGIDYLHLDFLGSGSADDYAANDHTTIDDGFFPTAKVVGGWDFAGDDPDPMEVPGEYAFGHGTHVSGTTAGVGVNSDDTPYNGVYDETTPFDELDPGPGVAPDADLYALRAFGPEDPVSTISPIDAAIEWAVDPDGDGDFSDHLDVINMSLGVPYAMLSLSTEIVCDNAALAGVVPVASAGNSADGFFLMASPGSSNRTIGVAATHHFEEKIFGPVRVNEPAGMAGDLYAVYQRFGPYPGTAGLTADVVLPVPADACGPLTNAIDVAGQIVLVDWLECGIDTKAAFAQSAGAAGVIVDPTGWPLLPLNYSGSRVDIPVAMIRNTDAAALRASIPDANVTLVIQPMDIDISDVVTEYSSRGPRTPDSLLKPDVAAPGGLTSAASHSSGGSSFKEGTSMATPLVSGAMALLKQLHPDWTVEELKALLMNTSVDVFCGPNQTEPHESLNRVGAGRIDLERAVAAEAIAMVEEPDGLVSASFGFVEVEDTLEQSRTVEVMNRGNESITFDLGIDLRSDLPGATVLPSVPSVTVPPGETRTLTLDLTVIASQLRDLCDPGAARYVPAKAPFGPPLPTAAKVQARSCPNEEAGYLELAPRPPHDDHPTLRLPVHAVLRPVSTMAATEGRFVVTEDQAEIEVHLAGSDLNSGIVQPGIRSLLSAFELAEISPVNPDIADVDRLYDLSFVGVTSDYGARLAAGQQLEDAVVSFAVVSHAPWAHSTVLGTFVWIDRDLDGDYDVTLSRFPSVHWNTDISWSWPYWGDVHWTYVADLETGEIRWQFPVNTVPGTEVKADLLNTDAMILSARVSDLGLVDGASAFDYVVETFVTAVDWPMDQSAVHRFDPARPGLNLTGTRTAPMFWDDLDGAVMTMSADRRAFIANGSKGLLLVHHHNAGGQRTQVIEIVPEVGEAPRETSGRVMP